MEDHALAKTFPHISRGIVRIIAMHDGSPVGTGTGYIVGCLRKTFRPIIATARHLFPFIQNPSPTGFELKIESYNADMSLARLVTFPIRQHDDPEGYHLAADPSPQGDLAVLVAPRRWDDGRDFLPSVDSLDGTIPPVQDSCGPGPATKIAWAGFPGLLAKAEFFGAPQLCYFEGTVACWAVKDGRLFIVVDGHAMPGVSGGPVWFYNEHSKSVRVAGIISSYVSYVNPESFRLSLPPNPATDKRARMPGFVFVQPIFDLVAHVHKWGR